MAKELIKLGQLKRLNQLLNQAKLTEHKADLVKSFSSKSFSSSKDLLETEADSLISHLEAYMEKQPSTSAATEQQVSADRMRKKIIHYAYEMRWTKGGKCDLERLNNWCVHYGQFKKQLNQHTYQELPKLLSQFEKVYKSFLVGSVKL